LDKKPLKIAICSWASGIGGGAARMESYYYQFYDRALFEPIFISLITRDTDPLKNYKPEIPFIQLDLENRYLNLVEVLKEQKVDIVQFQGSFNPLVVEAAKEAQVPLLVEVLHNIEDGLLYDQIDLTVCVSDAVNSVQNKSNKIVTIKNGIDVSQYKFQENKKINDNIVFLQVGRRSKSTVNLDMIAEEILKDFPNSEFWICGGEQSGESTKNIKFFGVVDNIEEFYLNADYLVQLSENEPFGLVAIEAMALGTPVILSNSGGFKEIVTNEIDGYLVDAPYQESVVELIKNILTTRNSELYEEIRRNGRKKVENNFDIKKVIKVYEEAIVNKISEKKVFNNSSKKDTGGVVPPDALVGEALYDFLAVRYQQVGKKVKALSQSMVLISEVNTMRTAHDLALFLYTKSYENYNKGIFSYLFACGNSTMECLEQCATEPEELYKRGILERYFDVLIKDIKLYFNLLLVFIEFCFVNNLKTFALKFVEKAILESENEPDLNNEFLKIKHSFVASSEVLI